MKRLESCHEHGARVQCGFWPDGQCTNRAIEVLCFFKAHTSYAELPACRECIAETDDFMFMTHDRRRAGSYAQAITTPQVRGGHMEESQAQPEEAITGDSGLQPQGETDGHGSITPTSPPHPSTQSGDPLDPATKAAIAGDPPAAGEASPPANPVAAQVVPPAPGV